jgi:hypothetical protein
MRGRPRRAVTRATASVTAQHAASPAGDDPTHVAATGFRVATPAFWKFLVSRGGPRTFGYPISNAFPVRGQRVQLSSARC